MLQNMDRPANFTTFLLNRDKAFEGNGKYLPRSRGIFTMNIGEHVQPAVFLRYPVRGPWKRKAGKGTCPTEYQEPCGNKE